MQKSPTGNELPQWQRDWRIRAEHDCANHQIELGESLADRAARREQQSRRPNR